MSAPAQVVRRDLAVKRPWYVRLGWGVGVTVLIGATVYVGFMLVLFASFDTPYSGRSRTAWSKESWLAAEANTSDGARYLMLHDLLAKHALIGMSREEIEQLLGTQHDRSLLWGQSGISYCLGPEPSANAVDDIWLDLHFDEAGHVLEYETPTD